MSISFTLNGRPVEAHSPPASRLLDVLRGEFGLTGAKCGCGEGACGACAVLLDGKLVNSCLTPLGSLVGHEVLTIEGYRETKRFAALARAFDDMGAVQCGFCTPGMLLAAEALLRESPRPTDEEIVRGLSGNLCRCTGYNMIIRAVRAACEEGEGLWQ